MESTIALAVMVKATKVFKFDDKGDSLLSFPLNPIAFKKGELNFAAGDLTNEQALSLSEFSRIVNLLPSGIVWQAEERYLWQAYHEVLNDAVKLAASTRTPEAEADYQKALQVLRTVKGDGAVEDTPAVIAYNQYKDAWFLAQEDYNNQKSEAELSTDPAVKQHWRDVDEPAFRDRIRSVERDWEIKGFRGQVERAQQTVAALGSQDPHKAWGEWQTRYQPILDERKDTNEQGYAWSGFTPSNALEAGSWLRFTLTGDEANALIKEAPVELRKRLAPNPVNFEIESLSFDYSSVKITRPWFDSEVFKARFWQFYDSSKLLSDGKSPASGSCPLYPTALVFVRRLEIKLKPNSPRNEEAIKRLGTQKALSLGFIKLAAPTTPLTPQKLPVLLNTQLGSARVATKPIAATFRTPASKNINLAALTVKPGVLSQAGTPQSLKLTNVSRLQNKIFTRIRLPSVTAKPGTPPPPPPPPVGNEDEVYVMAFICKRLPKCPDPDLNLQW